MKQRIRSSEKSFLGPQLPAADAHGDHAELRVAALHLAQDGGRQLGAGAPQGMSQGDGAAVGIDALGGEFGEPDRRQRLHREGLVELDNADVGERERFRDGHHGAGPRDAGRHAGWERFGGAERVRIAAHLPRLSRGRRLLAAVVPSCTSSGCTGNQVAFASI